METLYDDLMNLCNDPESSFYCVDQTLQEAQYRIFSYRLASHSMFEHKNAKNARGTMFDITDPGNPKLVCLPLPKFFNLHEYKEGFIQEPFQAVYEKADGSLISTFIQANGDLGLKSMTSLHSDHVKEAWDIINNDRDLLTDIKAVTMLGYTLCFELCSPNFQIVLPYVTPHLRFICSRNRKTGEVIFKSGGYSFSGTQVESYNPTQFDIETVKEETHIEGYVAVDANGTIVKLKTPWYIQRHSVKDQISSFRNFIPLILAGEADDVRELYLDDPNTLDYIDSVVDKVIKHINYVEHELDDIQTWPAMDRKAYANEINEIYQDKDIIWLAMRMYNGGRISALEFFVDQMKDKPRVAAKKWKEIVGCVKNVLTGDD